MSLLKPGDIFAVRNTGLISWAITNVTKFWSSDNKAEMSHAGVIISESGDTFEARRKIGRFHIADYEGCKIIIGRPFVTEEMFFRAFRPIADKYEGKVYPYWRILLHLIPPMAKYIGTGDYLVCAPLTGKIMYECNVFASYRGLNPDHIADRIEHWKVFRIIFKGAYCHD